MVWKVDPQRSKIEFIVRHFLVTKVRGQFRSFEGEIDMNEAYPQASVVGGTVDVATIHTGISLRDKSLRAAGFFNVKQYPRMSFRSTRVGTFFGDTFKVYGELTIKNITREVVFEAVNKGELPAGDGKRRRAFAGTIELNRRDFDLKWNPLVEIGGILVGPMIRGVVEIEVVES
jgi:polyisoprenoid-binding protein YceI